MCKGSVGENVLSVISVEIIRLRFSPCNILFATNLAYGFTIANYCWFLWSPLLMLSICAMTVSVSITEKKPRALSKNECLSLKLGTVMLGSRYFLSFLSLSNLCLFHTVHIKNAAIRLPTADNSC